MSPELARLLGFRGGAGSALLSTSAIIHLDKVLRAFSARRKRLSGFKTPNIDWSVVAEPQWRVDDVGVAEFVEIAQWVDEQKGGSL